MQRYTKVENNQVTVAPEEMEQALLRLAGLEDMLNTLEEEQTSIPQKLEQLRAQGKDKTVQFKELMARKLANMNVKLALERHGIKG